MQLVQQLLSIEQPRRLDYANFAAQITETMGFWQIIVMRFV